MEVKVDELDKNLLPLTLLPPFMILLGSSSIVLHIFPNNQCLTIFACLPIFYPISKLSDNLAVDNHRLEPVLSAASVQKIEIIILIPSVCSY